jgi:hypothetical protein
MQKLQEQKALISSVFYRHIIDLPLNRFIQVAINSDFSALVISGEPTEEELSHAWGTIMQEYSEAIGDQETRLQFNLFTEINKLQLKIDQVALIVSILRKYYVPAFAKELNKLLITNLVFDINNREDYDRKLQQAINKSKGFKIALDLKLDQYAAMQGKEVKSEAVSKEYFYSVLITLSNQAKYQIPDTITVFEFCERIKRFNKEMELKK